MPTRSAPQAFPERMFRQYSFSSCAASITVVCAGRRSSGSSPPAGPFLILLLRSRPTRSVLSSRPCAAIDEALDNGFVDVVYAIGAGGVTEEVRDARCQLVEGFPCFALVAHRRLCRRIKRQAYSTVAGSRLRRVSQRLGVLALEIGMHRKGRVVPSGGGNTAIQGSRKIPEPFLPAAAKGEPTAELRQGFGVVGVQRQRLALNPFGLVVLAAVIELAIRRLYTTRDATFRSICEDYSEALRPLRHWQSAGSSSDSRIEQYRELVSELESKISNILEGSKRSTSG